MVKVVLLCFMLGFYARQFYALLGSSIVLPEARVLKPSSTRLRQNVVSITRILLLSKIKLSSVTCVRMRSYEALASATGFHSTTCASKRNIPHFF